MLEIRYHSPVYSILYFAATNDGVHADELTGHGKCKPSSGSRAHGLRSSNPTMTRQLMEG